ncbi:MAG TPA: MBL fold metallo-hydrolase [Candidatus Limnocylindrales bacterium]|nr:MBL fold metallo-hydrolase [Candidatus Limnocylindrales bacterium]
MNATIWGSRGSLASAGRGTVRYGGNTACVEVETTSEAAILLDAGTGIRPAGIALADRGTPIHVLLTHLHMDHILGLGFFRPLFETDREVHIWGPPSTTRDLRARLSRYLSPPLFPVRIRDIAAHLTLHDVPYGAWTIEGAIVTARAVIHPGPTVGYRIETPAGTLAYLPDHEPALGGLDQPRWLSGYDLARDADVLLHDGQYSDAEYTERTGWGHSSVSHAARFADLVGARTLLLIHHDPDHDDETVDELVDSARRLRAGGTIDGAREGDVIDVGGAATGSRSATSVG